MARFMAFETLWVEEGSRSVAFLPTVAVLKSWGNVCEYLSAGRASGRLQSSLAHRQLSILAVIRDRESPLLILLEMITAFMSIFVN